MDYGDESIIRLEGGGSIRTATFKSNPEGSDYVRVCDREGEEIGYWIYDEWIEDPQLVMGSILGAASSTQ